MRRRAWTLLATIAAVAAPGCEPSDAQYVDFAKRDPALEGMKVISSRIEVCCANYGKVVYFTTEGPNGKAACTFQIMNDGLLVGLRSGGGGCHPME